MRGKRSGMPESRKTDDPVWKRTLSGRYWPQRVRDTMTATPPPGTATGETAQ